jgi:transcriptional regulator of arginine metabolism
MNYSEIFATIGDDSTVFIVCKTDEDAADFRGRINSMVSS